MVQSGDLPYAVCFRSQDFAGNLCGQLDSGTVPRDFVCTPKPGETCPLYDPLAKEHLTRRDATGAAVLATVIEFPTAGKKTVGSTT